MTFLQRIRFVFTRRGISLSDLDTMMERMLSGQISSSGAIIGEQTALGLPAVWACVDLISKAGAVLPGHVYRRGSMEGERQIARDHFLYPIVHDRANQWLPASEWRRIALSHLLTYGNHFSWIERGIAERPSALWVIPPDKIRVERKMATEVPRYFVRDINGQYKEFPAEDILHIRGLGFDGTNGYSPISMLRNAFGLLAANEQSASNMHRNGITSRLALSYDGQLEPEQITALRDSMNQVHAGLHNQFKTVVLPFGVKAQPISINPNDAQFLETWKYSDAKIYQIFGVPPHMVGDTEKATSWGTGIEQQTIGFVTFTLLPWMDLIETWLELRLLPGDSQHFVEYDAKGLMRADIQARAMWHRTMVEIGVASPNDVRRTENEQPYEGGDVYRRPLNTAFVDKSGRVVALTPPGAKQNEDKTEPIEV